MLQPWKANSTRAQGPCPPLAWPVSSSPRRTGHQLLLPGEGNGGRGLPQEHAWWLPPAPPQHRTSPTPGSQVWEPSEDPWACPQACSQLQGMWEDKLLMAASLLRRQEAADFSTTALDSSARRPPGARAWRQVPGDRLASSLQARRRLRQRRHRPGPALPSLKTRVSAGGGGPTGSWPWGYP